MKYKLYLLGFNILKYCSLCLIAIGLFSVSALKAQTPTRFTVEFTDKVNTPFSVNQPLDYLSQRAIDRRIRQNISISINDLPVDPVYIAGVTATGAQVLTTSKWLNSVVIYVADTNLLSQIRALPYVKKVKYVGMKKKSQENTVMPENKWDIFNRINLPLTNQGVATTSKPKNITAFDYGPSANQIEMIKGDVLHSYGYRGQGMMIAVIDAGFYNADILPCFDSLRLEGRLLGTKDFVEAGGNVYAASTHGMNVLSTMAANIPGEIIGTAPKASYWLLRSEDQNTEYIVEEDYWVTAAEFADSVGADIINSSLGYTQFDDASLNHTQADMDGNTTDCSIGADIAASKGILCVIAAGNSGGSQWQIISAPADADSVLAVGAVDASGVYAAFSSTGPSADGRIKPNVATQGQGTIIYSSWGGGVVPGNGTSFASPVMAGAAACLWQAHPNAGNMDILNAIQNSASQFANPDGFLGYGIPNLEEADKKLFIPPSVHPFAGMTLYPNPSRKDLILKVFFNDYQDISVEIFDNLGKRILPVYHSLGHPGENSIKLSDTENLPCGIYLIKMKSDLGIYTSKWLKM